MNTNDLLAAFHGSKAQVARAFGVSAPAVSRWVRNGVVPEKQVLRWKLGLIVAPEAATGRLARKQLQIAAARRWADKG
jgi:transcriptional regulator with XRE-family HTH domain